MVRVEFKYRDQMSRGEWRTQECIVSSVQECKKIYGLDEDPTIIEYEITNVEEL